MTLFEKIEHYFSEMGENILFPNDISKNYYTNEVVHHHNLRIARQEIFKNFTPYTQWRDIFADDLSAIIKIPCQLAAILFVCSVGVLILILESLSLIYYGIKELLDIYKIAVKVLFNAKASKAVCVPSK